MHSLYRPHPRFEPADLAEAVGRQILRIDALLLGAVVIAAVMVGGLLFLQGDPVTSRARDCQLRLHRDTNVGFDAMQDGVRRAGDRARCRVRAAQLRPAG